MIIAMKKVTLLLHDGSRRTLSDTIGALRDFGGFHFGFSRDSSVRLEQLEEALSVLKAEKPKKSPATSEVSTLDGEARAKQVLSLRDQREELQRQIAAVEAMKQWYGIWGPVSLEAVSELRDAGYDPQLYEMDAEEFEEAGLDRDDRIFVVGRHRRVLRLLRLAAPDAGELDVGTSMTLPDIEADQLASRYQSHTDQLAGVQNALFEMTADIPQVVADLAEERCRIEWEQVAQEAASVDEIPGVRYLCGYIPINRVDAFAERAGQNAWGYTLSDPEEADHPPTLLDNPGWTQPVYTLYRFLGLRIGYREIDVSSVFLIFYALITGLLVADAGYGLVYLLLTLLAHHRFPGVDNRAFHLGYLLSASIIVCGALTGAWFGSETVAGWPGFRDMTIPALAAFDLKNGGMSDNIRNMMELGFAIGIIHLVLAHLMRGWKQRHSLAVIGHVGWISFLSMVYALVRFLIFKAPLPDAFSFFLILGIVLMFVFSRADMGIVAGMKSLMATFVFDVIGGFSDMISYIRIPIVGLVTVVLGSLFNMMMAGSILVLPITMICHVFGMILALMAVLIHATRLKSMEFSNHAGMEWNGEWYQPFAGKETKQWI